MKKIHCLLPIALIYLAIGCQDASQPAANAAGKDSATATMASLPDAKAFQSTTDGKATQLFILKNKNNMQVAITNYGGRIVRLLVPDKNGHATNIVVGYDSI